MAGIGRDGVDPQKSDGPKLHLRAPLELLTLKVFEMQYINGHIQFYAEQPGHI